MKPLNESIAEYKKQLEKGNIQNAYKGLMEYMMKLRTHLKVKHPTFYVPSNLYQGYMDMSYFSFTPKSLTDKKLKVAIVFIHDKTRFEVWLGAVNKKIQHEYWNLIKESGWDKYQISPKAKGVDSIIEHTLVNNPDFNDIDNLTKKIEKSVLEFSDDVLDFLSKKNNISNKRTNAQH